MRVFNDRGAFACAARVSDDARPGVLVAPMGWWNRGLPRRAQRAGHHVAAADREGNAPTFNDNRVEIEAGLADQAVSCLAQQDAADGLVEAAAGIRPRCTALRTAT